MRSLPIPRIIRAGPSCALFTQRVGPGPIHQGAHAPDGAVEPAKNRLAYQEMPDIEFPNSRNCRYGGDGLEAEAVAGVTFEAELVRPRGGGDQPLQFSRSRSTRGGAIG